jgi:hypothetical protein
MLIKCTKVETESRPKFMSACLSGLIYVIERTEMRRKNAVGHASDGWKEVLFIMVHIGMIQLKTHTLKYNNHSPDRDREEKEGE